MLDFKDVVDTRDIIVRIEELSEFKEDCIDSGDTFPIEDSEELAFLLAIQDEADCSPDYIYGESLISEDYFTDYIQALIEDCYELPEGLNTGRWPFNHMQMDYEAAAEEAKQDYIEFSVDGYSFLIRV